MAITQVWLVDPVKLPGGADRVFAFQLLFDDDEVHPEADLSTLNRSDINRLINIWFENDDIDIADYSWGQTPRSIADGLAKEEWIIYPDTMALEQALNSISPQRVADV